MTAIRKPHSLLLAVLCTMVWLTAIAEPDQKQDFHLQPYKLLYKASYNGMSIKAERELQPLPNGNWLLTTNAENFMASITEQGTFQIDANSAIHNISYQYERSVLGKKKTENLIYDHPNKLATYTTKKKHREVKLDKDYLNRLSYQVQLQQDLIDGVEALRYQVISRGRLKEYRFERVSEELLNTPMGDIRALRVNRIREDNERETSLWFAPDMEYLLVKLWQREEDGEEYELLLKEGQLSGEQLKGQ